MMEEEVTLEIQDGTIGVLKSELAEAKIVGTPTLRELTPEELAALRSPVVGETFDEAIERAGTADIQVEELIATARAEQKLKKEPPQSRRYSIGQVVNVNGIGMTITNIEPTTLTLRADENLLLELDNVPYIIRKVVGKSIVLKPAIPITIYRNR